MPMLTEKDAVEFWESYRLLVAESVFLGIVTAHAFMAGLRWLNEYIKRTNRWRGWGR